MTATASAANDPSAIAARQWYAFTRAYDNGHADYVTDANKFSDFYNGEQWDEATRKRLEGERKPVLTINVAKRTINTIKGTFSNSRADIVYKPTKQSTDEQARTVTLLVDHILQSNKYHHVEAQVAFDGWVMDRGYFDVRMDFSDNVLGEVRITSLDPRDVILDPDAKDYDPKTWSEVHVVKWMSIDDIAATYGQKKADELLGYVEVNGQQATYGSRSVRFGDNAVSAGTSISPGFGGEHQEDAKRVRAVRVIERQYKKMGKVREFVDIESGDTREVPQGWDEARVRAVAEKFGLVIRKALRPRIRWTVTVDHTVLHDEWSPYDRFTIVPYFPYFLRGRPTGIMRDLVSPQEQLNKTESQELHIVNTTANSGWNVEAGSLVNMSPEDLEERGAETGLVVVHARGRTPPEKIKPNAVPTGIDRISQKSYQYIAEIPGIAPLVEPRLKSDVSGVAYNRASDNALNTLRPVFENIDFTRELLADVIIHMVQRFYTEARIFRITDWRHPEQPEIDVEINTDVLNNVTMGEYDIVATSAPAQDTAEDREFAQIMEMRSNGVESIPDYHVVLASNIKNKQLIAEETKQIQGFGEPTEQELETQQLVEQLQMRNLMAQIAELEAKTVERHANAGLAAAKADVAISAEQREGTALAAQHQREVARLKADVAKAAANLMNKIELAEIHSEKKEQLTRYQTQMKGMENMLDRVSALELASVKASQPQQSTSAQ